MKYTYKIPPSTTETIVTIDVPPATAIINQEAPLMSMTGGTPPVVSPPVVTEPPTTGTRKNLILEEMFDGTLAEVLKRGNWSDEQRVKNAYSLTIVNSSARFELRRTDAKVSRSVRTEITNDFGTHFWFGGRVKLENWVANTGSGGESLFQVHSGLNAPPFGIVIYGNSIQFTSTPDDSSRGSKRITVGTVSDWNNKWTDIVLHLNFAKSGGILEMWVNGRSVAKVEGLTSGDLGVYLKFGMNAFMWAGDSGTSTVDKRVFYWDTVRIGNANATYDDVKP